MSQRKRPRVPAQQASPTRAHSDTPAVAALEPPELLALLLGQGSLAEPTRVAEYVQARYGDLPEEILGGLYLDSRRRLLGERVLFQGRRYHDSVFPSPILRHGLLLGATGIVLFRTVAGDPRSLVSPEDRLFALRLGECSEVVGFKLLDLLLVAAGGRWASAFRADGPAGAKEARSPTARVAGSAPPRGADRGS